MKQIPLTQGKAALVDDEDYDFLMQWKWHFGDRYARRSVNGKTISMHRQIMNHPHGLEIDHIDGNTLNNTRKNLRCCTRIENSRNLPSYKNGTSTFKGVSWHKDNKKWRAQIRLSPQKKIHLGEFSTEIEAARAYNAAAIIHHGNFARINKGV